MKLIDLVEVLQEIAVSEPNLHVFFVSDEMYSESSVEVMSVSRFEDGVYLSDRA